MVLANGSIVTASKTSNPDLLAAIKGGGNAFGIVTKFVLQAYTIGQVREYARMIAFRNCH